MTGQDSTESVKTFTRRRRSFIAARKNDGLDADTIPLTGPDEDLSSTNDLAAIEANEDPEDIPVLTEVVLPAAQAAPEEEMPHDFSARIDARIEQLATEMSQAIGRQLAYELPTLIEATLLNASEDLRDGITSTMETALREFIARRRQLDLPLNDPDAEFPGGT